jgi:predicted amidohydrolase
MKTRDEQHRNEFNREASTPSTGKIQIGTWQGPVIENDFDSNLDKVCSVLHENESLGLDFLCFPEAFLSGYSAQAVRQSSTTLDDPRLLSFVHQTRNIDTVILVGMSERWNQKIYNTQLVIYQGEVLGKYHKTILTSEDTLVYTADLEMPVFQAKGICFGVVICHDTSFVEPALCLRWKGARLLFTPHYNDIPPEGIVTAEGRITFWEHRAMVLNNQAALATLLKMVVVRSNIVTVQPGHLGAGDAAIWDMDGKQVAAGTPFTECLVTAAFDRGIFEREHWIDRNEVPIGLVEKIAQAARVYKAGKEL